MPPQSPERAGRTRIPAGNVFGDIPGVPVGTYWASRQECSNAGVHPPTQAGIYGNRADGAYSIVLSGVYEDDVDKGDRIIYTGSGGLGPETGPEGQGRHIRDQSFDDTKNAALKTSMRTGEPVRVIRGHQLRLKGSDFAPPGDGKNYRYDGLYTVVKASLETGKSGFKVCRFELERLPNQPPIPRREGTSNIRQTKRRAYSPIPEPKYEGTPIPPAPLIAGSSSLPNSSNMPPQRLEPQSLATRFVRPRTAPTSPIEPAFTASQLPEPHAVALRLGAPPYRAARPPGASRANAPSPVAQRQVQPRRSSITTSTPSAWAPVNPAVTQPQAGSTPTSPTHSSFGLDPRLKRFKFKKKSAS
ncbi:PUA-like domain-containing protein [Rhodofomes roseus]|uniref:PUA-like domain-containing protein n=1 Tax=Rhodofomes roseus TaxID=34475 RepID=A0ABQ8KLY2_9APHY|nr:PUA-like domain-containing protein [Rhodofomes roseus]KAH9838720.1 PUA-like domain-containing protein [Rhodofomes roseus]